MSFDPEIFQLEHVTEAMPVGAVPDHCSRCKCAAAGHKGDIETLEVSSLCVPVQTYTYCRIFGFLSDRRIVILTFDGRDCGVAL